MSIAYVDIGDHTTKIYCNQKETTQRTIVCLHDNVIECGDIAVRVSAPYDDTTFRDIISHLASLEDYEDLQKNKYDPRLIFAHFLRFIMTSTQAQELILIKHNWWTYELERRVQQSAEIADIGKIKFVEAYEALFGYVYMYLPNDKHEEYIIFDFGASITEAFAFKRNGDQLTLTKYGSCNIGGDKLTIAFANFALEKIYEKDDEKINEYKEMIPKNKRLQTLVYETAENCRKTIIPNLQIKFEVIAIPDAPFDYLLPSNDIQDKFNKYSEELNKFVNNFINPKDYDKEKIELEWIGANSFTSFAKNIFDPQYELFKPNFSYVIGAEAFSKEKIDFTKSDVKPILQNFEEKEDDKNVIKQKNVSIEVVSKPNDADIKDIKGKFKENEYKHKLQMMEDAALNDIDIIESYVSGDNKEKLLEEYNKIKDEHYQKKLDIMIPLIRNDIIQSYLNIDVNNYISNDRTQENENNCQTLHTKVTEFMKTTEFRSVTRKVSFLKENCLIGFLNNILDQFVIVNIEDKIKIREFSEAKQLAEKIKSENYKKFMLAKIEKLSQTPVKSPAENIEENPEPK